MQQRKTRLDGLIEKATGRARSAGRSVLVSATERIDRVDPLDILESADPALTSDRMFWRDPGATLSFAAIGAAHMFEYSGAGRFSATDHELAALIDNAVIDGAPDGIRGVGPIAVGGFSFDPDGPSTAIWSGFGSTRLFLPMALVTSTKNESWLTLNLIVDAQGQCSMSARSLAELADRLIDDAGAEFGPVDGLHDDLAFSGDDSRFESLVSSAVFEIERGKFDKVVLARSVNAESATEIDAFAVIRNLRRVHRSAFVFGLWSGEKAFVGASPELLARQEGREVRASSLAGTIERGRTPQEDAAKAAALETSIKDRAEHAAVRDALYDALVETCDNVVAPEEPVILSLSNVHHLHTPLSATLREGRSLLALIEKLHPTPAVGGAPREAALRFIRESENLDRGWYAAPVGWVGGSSGEFAVGLRSALVHGAKATLFAGCGIVIDSDPRMEVEESNLKLQAMKSALSESLVSSHESVETGAAASRDDK